MTLDSWQQWEGRVVGGRFALGPYLGGSDHSAVYLTDFGGTRAVVKVVGADTADAQLQLARWEAARNLAHPNLLRVFDTGLWHADEEQDMFFAVMEYADENLAEILSERALSPAEVREMLELTLTALGHLHANNLVHCDLKPSNVLAVGQELKLAVDGVRRSGSRVTGKEQDDWRAAPEVFNSSVSARNDIWAVGLLLVEAVTRQRPLRDKSKEDEVRLPDNLPEPFTSIAKECLQRDPAKRCSNAQIRQMLERPVEVKKPEAQVVPIRPEVKEDKAEAAKEKETAKAKENPQTSPSQAVKPAEEPASKRAIASAKPGSQVPVAAQSPTAKDKSPVDPRSQLLEASGNSWMEEHRSRFLPFGIALFIAVVAIAGMVWLFTHGGEQSKPASVGSETSQPIKPASVPRPAAPPASLATVAHPSQGAVAHQVMPEVSHSAQSTIHGVVKVRVQVNVNEAGQVALAGLAAHGPSRYFAKQALEAARQWTFTPPQVDGKAVASRWGVEFDFRRNGVKAESKLMSPRV